ncbi:hypothetical protein [Streptomyces sp. NPDC059076]|uniref:hypothetical protein n=1 Tax=unclassified Streptomyces TaxID=2593676 RepID=UPI00369A0175
MDTRDSRSPVSPPKTPVPRHLGPTFHHDYGEDRRDLATARRRVWKLRSSAARIKGQANTRAQLAQHRYRRRIQTAEQHLRALRSPRQPGQLIATLGDFSLYDGVLDIDSEEIPITGLRARYEGSNSGHYIYLTLPGGHERRVKLPRSEHTEDEVRDFASQITNTAVARQGFLAQLEVDIEEAEAELKAAYAATGERDKARQELAELTERQKQDHRLATAQDELEEAHQVWQTLTGRRPHW